MRPPSLVNGAMLLSAISQTRDGQNISVLHSLQNHRCLVILIFHRSFYFLYIATPKSLNISAKSLLLAPHLRSSARNPQPLSIQLGGFGYTLWNLASPGQQKRYGLIGLKYRLFEFRARWRRRSRSGYMDWSTCPIVIVGRGGAWFGGDGEDWIGNKGFSDRERRRCVCRIFCYDFLPEDMVIQRARGYGRF